MLTEVQAANDCGTHGKNKSTTPCLLQLTSAYASWTEHMEVNPNLRRRQFSPKKDPVHDNEARVKQGEHAAPAGQTLNDQTYDQTAKELGS